MENYKNNQYTDLSSAIVPVGRPAPTRRPRNARTMAILAGGVLAVAAAIRVTNANGSTGAGTTASPAADPIVTAPDASTAPQAPVQVQSDANAGSPSNSHMLNVAFTAQQADGTQPDAGGSGQSEAPTTAPSVSNGVDDTSHVTIAANKSAVITTRFQYTRISIGQPDIADFNALTDGSVLVTGKKAGSTQLILWDHSEHSKVIDIDVINDVQALQNQLRLMFPTASIQAKSIGGSIALTGHVPNTDVASQAVAVASEYAPKVLNFIEIGGGQQVQLAVKIAEVDRTASSELGVNLGFTDGVGFGGTNIGPSPFANGGSSVLGEVLDPGGLGSAGEGGATQFAHLGIGKTAVDVFVDALRQNNLARMLAEPNLIAISGQNASFLAGGSFPYPVAQASGGGTTTTIEFQNYGVTLNFVPIVLGSGRIRLKVNPTVSELDYAHEVQSAGTEVPGLTIRQVETTVEMNEGQTFAIAGLLQNQQTGSKQVTPLLGDLPVLGPLFRSVKYQRNETELVVLVTPHLVEALNPDQVPTAPGEHWRDPSETDLYINRDIGGEADVHGATTRPVSDGHAAALFHGTYGIAPAANEPAQTTDDARADLSDQSN
jgi:pilus assembly protein CpaC